MVEYTIEMLYCPQLTNAILSYHDFTNSVLIWLVSHCCTWILLPFAILCKLLRQFIVHLIERVTLYAYTTKLK